MSQRVQLNKYPLKGRTKSPLKDTIKDIIKGTTKGIRVFDRAHIITQHSHVALRVELACSVRVCAQATFSF